LILTIQFHIKAEAMHKVTPSLALNKFLAARVMTSSQELVIKKEYILVMAQIPLMQEVAMIIFAQA
jgi:hypothetical protein